MLTPRETIAVWTLLTWLTGRDGSGRPALISNEDAKAAARLLGTAARKSCGTGWSGAHVDRWFPDWIMTADPDRSKQEKDKPCP